MAGFGHRIGATLHVPGRGARRVLTVLVVLAIAASTSTAVALGTPALLRALGLARVTDPPPQPAQRVLGPLAADAPTPTQPGLAAQLDPLVGAGGPGATGLGAFGGVVLDPASGTTLWSRDASRPLAPGSTVKLLTAAAALLSLDPTSRLTTRVLAGPTPDTVVLVGGGDPTLSTLPPGRSSVYPGAPTLDALAAAVRAAHPAPIRQVLVDAGRYRGDGLAPGWLPGDVAGGFVTPITAVMTDGGRIDPTAQDGPRTADPAGTAGAALARLLDAGASAPGVAPGSAPPNAAVLGEVTSMPVADLVEQALRASDNVLAEVLAREVALARGTEPSFAGATEAVLTTLGRAGLDVTGTRLADGSGLSAVDAVPAALLAAVLARAAGSDPTSQRLRTLLTGLPVAGSDGTLDERFDAGPAASGRGYVRAKTGTLTDVSSLAGVVGTVDGRLLVFALVSNGTTPATVRPRLDAIAAALRGCGCR